MASGRSHYKAVLRGANRYDVQLFESLMLLFHSHLNKQKPQGIFSSPFWCLWENLMYKSLKTLQLCILILSCETFSDCFLSVRWPLTGLFWPLSPSHPPVSVACIDSYLFTSNGTLCCWVKTEGPDSCGHRLEECLPSGRENVISWDQQIRGQFLFHPSRSHFPSICSHSHYKHIHTRVLSHEGKWHLFFQLFPLFLHTWAWGTRGNLVFSCDKTHRGLCGFGRGE